MAAPMAPSKKPHTAPMRPPINVGAKPMYNEASTSTTLVPQPNIATYPTNSMATAHVIPKARIADFASIFLIVLPPH